MWLATADHQLSLMIYVNTKHYLHISSLKQRFLRRWSGGLFYSANTECKMRENTIITPILQHCEDNQSCTTPSLLIPWYYSYLLYWRAFLKSYESRLVSCLEINSCLISYTGFHIFSYIYYITVHVQMMFNSTYFKPMNKNAHNT